MVNPNELFSTKQVICSTKNRFTLQKGAVALRKFILLYKIGCLLYKRENFTNLLRTNLLSPKHEQTVIHQVKINQTFDGGSLQRVLRHLKEKLSMLRY